MALDVMSMIARLGIDKSEYEKGMKEAEGGFKDFGKGIDKMVSAAKKAIAAIGIGAAVKKGVDVFKQGVNEIAQVGDNIDKASQKLGISAKAYQEWDAVLQHSGASIDSLGIGMKTLSSKAAEGSDAFKKLGISQKDAAKMSREELFSRTITALQGVQDANKKAQLAQELFGRSAMELGPLLNTTAEDTQAMKDQVNALGGVLSDEAVKASAAYQDTLQDMTTAMDGVKRGLFASFLPAVTQVMQGVTDVFTGKGTANITKGIKSFIDNMGKTLPSMLKKGLSIARAIGSAVISAVPDVVSRITRALPKVWTGVKNYVSQRLFPAVSKLIASALGRGNTSMMGERLGKTFGSIFDKAVAVVEGIGKKVSKFWTKVLQPILGDIVEFVLFYVLPSVSNIMDKLSPVLSWVSGAVSGLFDSIAGWWNSTMVPIIAFIGEHMDAILPMVGAVVAGIAAFAIAKKISNIIGVIKGLFTVVKAHPFAIVIGAIAAVVGWVIHLYQTNEEARDKIDAAFTAIKGFWTDTLKPAFEEMYTYVVETLIPTLIEWWDTKLKPTIETVFTAIKTFWEETLKPALEDIYTYVVETLIPTLIEWWDTKLKPTIETVFTAIKTFWEETLKPALEDIYTYVVETLIPTLIEWWDTKLKPTIETVFTAIAGFWNDTLKPAFEDIYTYVTETLIPTLQEKWEAIKPIIETVFTSIKTFWEETAQPALQAFWDFINDKVVPIMQTLGDKFTEIWDKYLKPVADWVTDSLIVAWQGLKDQLSNLVDFISKVFSGDWKGAWDALVNMVKTPFEKLGEILKKPINAVIGLLNSMLSKVQGAINKMINGINDKLHMHFDGVEIGWPIYKTVAAFDWSPNIPTVNWKSIPLLASGGIVGNGGEAIVGEYRPEHLRVVNGKAVVTPLNTGRFPGGGQEEVVPRTQTPRMLNVTLKIRETEIARVLLPLLEAEEQRVGVRLATGGV